MATTCKELIKNIIYNPEQKGYDMETDDVSKLVAIAYFMGREEAAKEICDKARAVYSEQRERANACRYHNLANKIIGNIKYIYSSDYAGDMTAMFGSDITNITEEQLHNKD